MTSEGEWPEAWSEMAFLVFADFIVDRKKSFDVNESFVAAVKADEGNRKLRG
jgi:hypothetical protein